MRPLLLVQRVVGGYGHARPPKPPTLTTLAQDYTNAADEYNPYPNGGYVRPYTEDGVPLVTREAKRRP